LYLDFLNILYGILDCVSFIALSVCIEFIKLRTRFSKKPMRYSENEYSLSRSILSRPRLLSCLFKKKLQILFYLYFQN